MATTLAFRTVLSTVDSHDDDDYYCYYKNNSSASSTRSNDDAEVQNTTMANLKSDLSSASSHDSSRPCSTKFLGVVAPKKHTTQDDEKPMIPDDSTSQQPQPQQLEETASAIPVPEARTSPPDDAGIWEIRMTPEPAHQQPDEAALSENAPAAAAVVHPGGLSNLGNTCYLASALQMVASLPPDWLAPLVVSCKQPPRRPSELRDCLLRDTLEPLRRGETVRPQALKDAIDARSHLFAGFHQQDAHEFLTTLLDLLDEDYKCRVEEKEGECSNNCKNHIEEEMTMEDGTSPVAEQEFAQHQPGGEPSDRKIPAPESSDSSLDGTMMMENNNNEEEDALLADAMQVELDSTPSSKKARTAKHDCSPSDGGIDFQLQSVEQSQEQSALEGLLQLSVPLNKQIPHYPSFSELDVEAIGRLLHGNSDDTLLPHDVSTVSTGSAVSPYKLIGGRMNTADVVLTPYATTDIGNSSQPLSTEAALTTPSNNNNNAAIHTCSSSLSAEEPQDPPSPVDECFTTQVRVRLTCDSCKYSRSHKETYLHLSLEMGEEENAATTIEEGLRKFFGSCRQQVKCEKCFGETATQTTEIVSLPPALLIHFKRFIVDVSPDYTQISYRKNRSTVLYDPELAIAEEDGGVLSEFLAPDCILPPNASNPKEESSLPHHRNGYYRLQSVVHHIGSSASCGHYTADARHGDQWYHFNDAWVSPMAADAAHAESRDTAYMVLYTLQSSSPSCPRPEESIVMDCK